jgi:hypothetical protein
MRNLTISPMTRAGLEPATYGLKVHPPITEGKPTSPEKRGGVPSIRRRINREARYAGSVSMSNPRHTVPSHIQGGET